MKFLANIPEKTTTVIWKLQFIVWGFLLFSYYIIASNLPKVEKREYLVSEFYVMIAVSLLFIILGHIKKLAYSRIPVYGYMLSAVCAIYAGYRYISYTSLQSYMQKPLLLLALVAAIYIVFLSINTIMGVFYRTILEPIFHKTQFIASLICLAVIAFIFFYFLPASTFFSNYSEFAFPFQLLVIAFISNILFWSLIPALFCAVIREKYYYKIYFALFSVLIGIYAQYMIFNTNLGTLCGEPYHVDRNILLCIVNTLVWVLIVVGIQILGTKKKEVFYSVAKYLAVFVGLIHLVTYVTMILQADERTFKYLEVNFDYEDMFKVGADKNTIVFIIDAADNTYVEELMDREHSILDEFHDFTVYTNTCSVYDYTFMSLLQIATNVPFRNDVNNLERREIAWNTDYVKEYYKRLHEDGYKVEFFNFDNENTNYVLGMLDNAYFSEDGKDPNITYISYKKLRSDLSSLSKYMTFPTLLKGLAHIENVDLYNIVVRQCNSNCYANEEFDDKLNLSLGDHDKYVMYQHIAGCHPPDDNVDAFSYCMEIVNKYITQMKELGVYDDATIIVTSDHGTHDSSDITGKDMFASTPIFLIKQPGKTQEKYDVTSAPMYFTDIMPTILYCADLYDANSDADEALFGKTIFDYKEGDLRERTWYDRVNDPNYPKVGVYNTYYGYTYTGDYEEFKRVVENGENLTIYPVQIQNDGLY